MRPRLGVMGRDRVLGIAFSLSAVLAFGAVLLILFDVVREGLATINWAFLLEEPQHAGRAGGIMPILLSTFYVVGIAMVVAVPVGLATAMLLAEFSRYRRFATVIRKSLDVLAGVPSIVFGLFGNAFFCVYLGLGFSILSGGLTLACMALPIIVRATEEGFRAVPNEYRHGIFALGFSRWASVSYLILPMAVPGLVVGTILGFGRAIAETAALIFTSGYVDRIPESPLDSGRVLSVHIYDLAMNVPGGDRMAYGASLTLVLILIGTSWVTSLLAKKLLQRGIVT